MEFSIKAASGLMWFSILQCLYSSRIAKKSVEKTPVQSRIDIIRSTIVFLLATTALTSHGMQGISKDAIGLKSDSSDILIPRTVVAYLQSKPRCIDPSKPPSKNYIFAQKKK